MYAQGLHLPGGNFGNTLGEEMEGTPIKTTLPDSGKIYNEWNGTFVNAITMEHMELGKLKETLRELKISTVVERPHALLFH